MGRQENNSKKLISQRSCVGCRKVQHKELMIRIVRTPAGVIELDLTGKTPGRGAYLCKDEKCLKLAMKKHQLNRVFKQQVPDDLYDRLTALIAATTGDEQT